MRNKLAFLRKKKILILGFAREGQSTYKFLRKHFPDNKLAIADRKELKEWDKNMLRTVKEDKNINFHFGVRYLGSVSDYDLVIKTPGIPFRLYEIKDALEKGVEFSSQTKLFFKLCPGKIIGITGTKGKSTAASLTNHILSSSGIKSVILGNIGKPPLDYLDDGDKDTFFVFELSSHQLFDIDESPHIAILLNIFQEHGDYYDSFSQYLKAKANITKYQKSKDFLIYNKDFKQFEKIVKESRAQKIAFAIDRKSGVLCYRDKSNLVLESGGKKIALSNTGDVVLKGNHNLLNVMAAILASLKAGASIKNVQDGIKTFIPLKNRLEVVGEYKGITFVNDSLATIPEATIEAIDTFSRNVSTLICGGFDRGQDFKSLAEKIVSDDIENLILFPTTGKRIWQEVKKIKNKRDRSVKHFFVDNMKEAVRICFEKTPDGKVCLLSTASPSFSLFKDYEEEAALFRKFVKEHTQLTLPKCD